MKRIFVTGNAGAGKSTLAKQLAGQFGFPLYGLDRVVWRPGWRKASKEDATAEMTHLMTRNEWVIDGVSLLVQSRADLVIFLDVPRRVSFFRVAKRNLRFLFRSRPELPENCPEILIISKLIRIIWNFPSVVRPKILDQMSKVIPPKVAFHVRSRKDLDECLRFLAVDFQNPPASLT